MLCTLSNALLLFLLLYFGVDWWAEQLEEWWLNPGSPDRFIYPEGLVCRALSSFRWNLCYTRPRLFTMHPMTRSASSKCLKLPFLKTTQTFFDCTWISGPWWLLCPWHVLVLQCHAGSSQCHDPTRSVPELHQRAHDHGGDQAGTNT